MNDKPKTELKIPITVEFEDVDSFRIVHHVKLVSYLERARLRLLYELGFDVENNRYGIVMYNLDMRFSRPARLMDKLEVSVKLKDAHAYQLFLSYKIRKDKTLIAKATTGLAFTDLLTQKLMPVPEDIARLAAES